MSEPRLVLDGATVRYPSGLTVGPVTASFDRGLYHLQGENGSGKTSLLRCIAGAQRVSAGRVRVCGRDPLRQPAARADVGFVPAVPELPGFLRVDEAWQITAALRGRPDWQGEVERELLGIDGRMLLEQCSAGQRCRAELLAALAGDPPILLLDEVFSHLDPGAVERVARRLASWRDTRVILLTSHEALPVRVDGTIRLTPGGAAIDRQAFEV